MSQEDFLLYIVEEYFWWIPKDEKLDYAKRFKQKVLAQVMDIGTWEDLCSLVTVFSSEDLRDVLKKAEIGQFRPKSWSFWHTKLNSGKLIPPIPNKRVYE